MSPRGTISALDAVGDASISRERIGVRRANATYAPCGNENRNTGASAHNGIPAHNAVSNFILVCLPLCALKAQGLGNGNEWEVKKKRKKRDGERNEVEKRELVSVVVFYCTVRGGSF
jgi:hypothetical protein